MFLFKSYQNQLQAGLGGKSLGRKAWIYGTWNFPFCEYCISRIFKGARLTFWIFYLPTTKFSNILCASQLLLYTCIYIYVCNTYIDICGNWIRFAGETMFRGFDVFSRSFRKPTHQTNLPEVSSLKSEVGTLGSPNMSLVP